MNVKTKVKSDRRTLTSSLSGEVLRWLLARGHTQVEVARLLGVSESFISLVKSRERSFTIDHIQALADALNIPLGALLIQITERETKDPKTRAFMHSTAKIMRKADELSELLRKRIAAKGGKS